MIVTDIEKLRDPFVLCDNGVYYLYGSGVGEDANWSDTMWVCYKNKSGHLSGEWIKSDKFCFDRPEKAVKNFWAPEVHKYKGFYYLFATYFSSETNHRGCTIMKADNPEGPFTEITNGHITPPDWDAIDATFYVDADGTPWMIFVHEWTSTYDNVGTMAAAKLSADLTHFLSEPVELFRADDALWATRNVTDGCFMYTTEDNQLLMLWSNLCKDGYCVGIARSKNGEVCGEWEQDASLLFSKQTTGEYDGGHGMIFKDFDGSMYLSVHSPNANIEGCPEKPIFLQVCEIDGKLQVNCGKE